MDKYTKNEETKMRMKLLLSLPLVLLFGACGISPGRDFNTTDFDTKIIDGKTTKAEVIALLGKPRSTYRTPQVGEAWQYYKISGLVGTPLGVFGSVQSKMATITFNGDVVKSHSLSEGQSNDQMNGVFGIQEK